jgi:ABC-type uncharacterized transport system permease subunit
MLNYLCLLLLYYLVFNMKNKRPNKVKKNNSMKIKTKDYP